MGWVGQYGHNHVNVVCERPLIEFRFPSDMKKERLLKFIYSDKAKKLCEISSLLLTGTTWDKSKVVILQNFVVFSEYTAIFGAKKK